MSKQTRALELLDALIAKIETDITIAQTQDKKVEIAQVKVQVVQEAQKEQVKEAEKVEKGEKKENKKKKGENGKQNKKQQPQKAKLPPGADEDILAFAECDLRIS